MQYNINYDIGSLVLFAVTAVIFYFKKRIPCRRNVVFGALLGFAAASAVFDICSVLSTLDNVGRGVKTFFHIAYYITHTSIPYLFLLYVLFLTEVITTIGTGFKIALYAPICINYAFILTSPLTHLLIYVDAQGNYIKGPLQPISYVIALYYLLFGIIYAFKNRKMLSTQVVISISSFIGMTFIAVIIQIFNPTLLVECFGSALCILLIMFTLQNQDDMIDSVTKMLNRSTFVNNCTIKFLSETSFTILLIRIPDFTLLMKTFGARFSNSLLKSFSEYLYRFVNLGNGYYLEDECFALIFSKDSADAGKAYRDIHSKLLDNWQIGDVDTLITACFLRIDCPDDAKDIETLMDYIEQFKQINNPQDRLLHTNDINLYDKKRRIDVEHAIDKAIENRGFKVYYQPIYSCDRSRIVSCEALLRLIDDELGFIPPDEFIPIAEQNGKILRIGKFVFEEACRFIKKGAATALGIEYIQVNLSVVQCMQCDLVEQLMNIMDKYKVDPSAICLEITETAAAYTPHIMERNIRTLSDIGIRFALDDYGSGYSNMTYLLSLPFRFIKLEKDIVWAGFKSEKAKVAIESTVAMIKKLNMQIVAEGIEEQYQLDSLTEMGCDFIQGYYFSKPVPENEFLDVLKKHNDSLVPQNV